MKLEVCALEQSAPARQLGTAREQAAAGEDGQRSAPAFRFGASPAQGDAAELSRSSAAPAHRSPRADFVPVLRRQQALQDRRGRHRDAGRGAAAMVRDRVCSGEVQLPLVREVPAARSFHVIAGLAGAEPLTCPLSGQRLSSLAIEEAGVLKRHSTERSSASCVRLGFWWVGGSLGEAIRSIGVTDQTYYRWRKEYGGLKMDQAKRLKELERENTRLRKAVADLTLDKQVLAEVAKGIF
jgi:hypothetical protein